jgi:hypothetical protein
MILSLVTPWSVLPVALPPWHTLVRPPKSPAADSACDVDTDAWAEAEAEVWVLLDPARLQPTATTATAATAAKVLIDVLLTGLTGLLLADAS